jgi:cis-3-alkyl-4-acyloxetan-2-one decarboxylase
MQDDWQTLYPFKSRELVLGGQRYHYVDEGQGEPLLLVHGNPTWSFMWRELIVALRDRYRVIAIDHIGCGLSDKPKQYPYHLQQHIENLGALVRELDLQNVTLIGHDWGGAIGLGAAVAAPERFARFIVSNTAAFRSLHIPWRIRICHLPIFATLAIRGLNAFLKAALRTALENPDRITPAVRAGYLAPYDSWANRIAIDRFVKDIPLSPRHPSYAALVTIENGLQSLADRPWLLLWGMRDWCFHPWYLQRFQEIIPRAEVHQLASAGHLILEDEPEEAIAAIRSFVERHPIEEEPSGEFTGVVAGAKTVPCPVPPA